MFPEFQAMNESPMALRSYVVVVGRRNGETVQLGWDPAEQRGILLHDVGCLTYWPRSVFDVADLIGSIDEIANWFGVVVDDILISTEYRSANELSARRAA